MAIRVADVSDSPSKPCSGLVVARGAQRRSSISRALPRSGLDPRRARDGLVQRQSSHRYSRGLRSNWNAWGLRGRRVRYACCIGRLLVFCTVSVCMYVLMVSWEREGGCMKTGLWPTVFEATRLRRTGPRRVFFYLRRHRHNAPCCEAEEKVAG